MHIHYKKSTPSQNSLQGGNTRWLKLALNNKTYGFAQKGQLVDLPNRWQIPFEMLQIPTSIFIWTHLLRFPLFFWWCNSFCHLSHPMVLQSEEIVQQLGLNSAKTERIMTYQLDCSTFPSNSGAWRFRLESPQTKHVYNPGGDKTIASWGPAGFFDPTKPTLKLPVWHVAKNATWEVVGIDQKKEGVGEKHPGNKFVGYLFQEYQQFHLWRTSYHNRGLEG